MRKFSISVVMSALFMVMAHAEAKDDPCAQFSNQQEQNVCYTMTQDLTSYGDGFVKQHSMPMYSVSIITSSSELRTPSQSIQSPTESIQERSIPIQQKEKAEQGDSGFNAETKRRNIFQ